MSPPRKFGNSPMSELNLNWFVRGVIVDSPGATVLRALAPGDSAVVIPGFPGCTKADPVAIMFGVKPMYLEFDRAGPNNAALNLRNLELALPGRV